VTVDQNREIRSPADEDAATESAVLQHVLALHPALASPEELLRVLGGERSDFAQRDAIERAVRDLVGAGLLHNDGRLVAPTLAALRFDRLLGD
jgi:hypothetical protein